MKAKEPKKTRYVLILDDNPAHADLVTEILDRHFTPVIIHTVDTFRAGIEFLSQTSYNLIITDIIVGGESIEDYVKEIRRRYHDIPIIVITGRGDESLAAQLVRWGAAEYLVKKRSTLDTLPHTLEKYLKS